MLERIRTAPIVATMLAALLAAPAAFGEDRLLLLSAYPTEQALLLEAARPVTEVGTFNGRRFYSGSIGDRDVVMGLTGIGMVDSATTTEDALAGLEAGGVSVTGIIFSGVAGGAHLGDVMIPAQWRDGRNCTVYDVDPDFLALAQSLEGTALDDALPIEDATCSGVRAGTPADPVRVEGVPVVRVGGLGSSADPFGDRAVPCLSSAGSLLGCEACGAPLNESPGIEKFAMESAPFFLPELFLFSFFESSPSCGGPSPVVGDMETAAAADVARSHGIPFIAFRAASDGRTGDPNPVTGALGFPFQFAVYQQLAADNAARTVLKFLEDLP